MSACILVLITGMSFGNAAFAQRAGASIDLGALNMRYADSVKANAVALTPAAWTESLHTSFGASGTFSQFIDGGWSAQGDAAGSLYTPRYSLFLGEVEGDAGGSTHKDGVRTGRVLASARVHVANDYRGIWIGGGAGNGYDGAEWRSILQGEAAAWARFNAATAFLSVTPVSIADSVRYTDAQLSGSLNFPLFEIVATGGVRSGSRSRSWGSASVTAWIASRVAIVGSAGTYPVDLTQGFPGGRFASLSLRIGARRFPPSASSVSDVDEISGASRRPARFESRPLAGGTREIRIYIANAEAVELMGDFTSWRSVRLENAGSGWWMGSFRVPSGIHELNIRINGGRWIVPPGLESRRDELGGAVGILIVQ
jgi:hypothetical protein